MNKIKLKKFKQAFLDKQKELLDHQARLDCEIDAGGDEVDLIQGNILKNLAEKLSARDQLSLIRIQIAIKKIDEGTFGICEECEEDISEKRLMAIPESALCVDCAEFLEKKARQFG